MFDFHVGLCVYIACVCAGGRNLLITQLFILPVCYMSSSCVIGLHVYIYIYIICHMLSTCIFAYPICPGGTVEWPHGRVTFPG